MALPHPEPPADHIIRRQYKVWRAAAPFLYEVVLYQGLIWPSASVQFLRGSSSPQHLQCLLGAATSDADQPHLLLMEIALPPVYSAAVRRDITGAHSSVTHTAGKIKTLSAWPSGSDIRRIRLVRGVARSLAACVGDDDPIVSLYDIGALSSAPIPGRQSAAVPRELRKCSRLVGLGGLGAEASALTTSALHAGRVAAACSDDHGVYVWDVQACPDSETGHVPPVVGLHGHAALVTDAHYSPLQAAVLASASDDRSVGVWDDRTGERQYALPLPCAGSAVEWSPFGAPVLAAGGDDGVLYIWDVRRPDRPVQALDDGCNRDPFYMTRVSWAPFQRDVVATSGTNRRIMIWDIARQGMSQTPEEAAEGPPELAFVHGGHTATINDFDWSTDAPWTIASVSENNIVEVWAISETLRTPEPPAP